MIRKLCDKIMWLVMMPIACSSMTLMLSSSVVYIFSLVIAWEYGGFFSILITAVFLFIAQLYWAWEMWDITGQFLNLYGISIIAAPVMLVLGLVGSYVINIQENSEADTGQKISGALIAIMLVGFVIWGGWQGYGYFKAGNVINPVSESYLSYRESKLLLDGSIEKYHELLNVLNYIASEYDKGTPREDVKKDYEYASALINETYKLAEEVRPSSLVYINRTYPEIFRTKYKLGISLMAKSLMDGNEDTLRSAFLSIDEAISIYKRSLNVDAE